MRKVFVFTLLALAVFIAGCTVPGGGGNTPFQYSNNIVTIENYGVSTSNPYPGSGTSIDFWVKNNGDKPVTVSVDFFNVPSALILTNGDCSYCNSRNTADTKADCFNQCRANTPLSCSGSAISISAGSTPKCTISNLQPFDSKPVKLDLTMPSGNLLSPTPYTIAFSISYDWSGYRSANIPIIDGVTKTQPTSQFSESQSTYGPISVEFQPPVGRTYKKDNQVITESWGVVGRPFEIKMSLQHIGNPSGIADQPLILSYSPPNYQISLNTTNLNLASGVYCAFKNTIGGDCVASNLASSTCIYPRSLELPGDLVCNFQSPDQTPAGGELVGIVNVNYKYNYRFTRTETIVEQPNPQ